MAEKLVHVSDSGGHRASYRDLFCEVLGFQSRTGPIKGRMLRELIAAKYVLCATIDGEVEAFLKLAFARALLNRPTVGILIFPPRFFNHARRQDYYLRRRLLQLAKRFPLITVLSIMPYDLCPVARLISRNWIHDPQMWDLWVNGAPKLPHTPLSLRVAELSPRSDVIAIIGRVSKKKCISELTALIENSKGRFSAVIAGKVDKDSRENIGELKKLGATIVDRYLSDREVLSLYRSTKYVWCHYCSGHNAASGIFGRAIQTGVIPIVRHDSYMATYAKYFGFQIATTNGKSITLHGEKRSITNTSSVMQKCDVLKGFACNALEKIQAPFLRS